MTNTITVNDHVVNVSELAYYLKRHMYAGARTKLMRITNCSEEEARKVVDCLVQQDEYEMSKSSTIIGNAETCIPRCPTCGSTNISKISTTSRMISTGLFGLASSKIGKTMECKKCGYKW